MSNHVENIITLQGDKQKIREMLEVIKNDDFGLGTIDFNKIIPMPESLNIETGKRTDRGLKQYKEFVSGYLFNKGITYIGDIPDKKLTEFEKQYLKKNTDICSEEWELGKTAWNNIQKYGAPTWYDWTINNWNTKCNAYGYDKNTDYSKNTDLRFQTTWAAPHPIIERLAEAYPAIAFEHEWADEDIGYNCGRRSYQNRERIEEYYPENRRKATEFACRIWEYDPAELDLCLNAANTKYINVENEEFDLIELFGKPMLFTNERLTNIDVPQRLYCYHLRRSDDGGRFCSVGLKADTNHGGSVITKEPINFGKQGYIAFTEDTEPNFMSKNMTLGEYMRGEFEQSEDESQQIGGMQL